MLSILKFSGKHWSRAALAWFLFAVAVEGLAQAGTESAESRLAAHNAAVALGVLTAADRARPQANYQVAKIDLKALDLEKIPSSAFGDAVEGDAGR